MPIDEEDQIEQQESAAEQKPKRPGPILHTPKSGPSIPFKIVIPVIVVAAIIAGGFWLYKEKIAKTPRKNPVVVTMPGADTAQMQADQPQEEISADTTAPKPAEQKEEPPPSTNQQAKPPATQQETPPITQKAEPGKTKQEPPPQMPAQVKAVQKQVPQMSQGTGGSYSIVVGSFKDKKNADELYGRWKEAGMQVYMTDKGAWHRVSLGKYPSQADAKREAEKMHDSFKDGYYIDTIE